MGKSKSEPDVFSDKLITKTSKEAAAVFMSRLQTSAIAQKWLQSAVLGRPIDRSGEPCPWYTFAAIYFLAGRARPEMRVFEYGSGHSTLWWAKRVSHVNTVEHDPGWFEAMRPQLPANVDYRHRELEYGGDYAREILTVDSQIDVAVIDGRDRVNCARACLQRLDAEAVIVWDNTERSRYQEGFDLLSGAGYRKLDFHGYGPVNSSPWRTSVFYKPGNCLGI